MNKGTLLGVSVGPGDPELLTLKAVRAIEACPVVAVPRTNGRDTLALDIVRGAVELEGKEILPLDFLMTADPEQLERSHRQIADAVAQRLDAGEDVALLNLGDVSIYSTFSYLMELLTQRGYRVQVIPGVPSFCAAAAALGISLTTMASPLHIIPAGKAGLEEHLTLSGTRVLMKSSRELPRVKQALRRAGLYDKAALVTNCGLPGQKICPSLDESDGSEGYFTTIIVKE